MVSPGQLMPLMEPPPFKKVVLNEKRNIVNSREALYEFFLNLTIHRWGRPIFYDQQDAEADRVQKEVGLSPE